MAPHMLTPGLTPMQAARLRDDLVRLTALPEASAAGVYIDADRLAGRYQTNYRAAEQMRASTTITQLRTAHDLDAAIIGFIAGLAHGVRLGHRFSPPPPARSKWISDEYKRLPEPNRRTVQRYIRKLLKAQTPPRPPAPPPGDELAAAREWTRAAGKLARRA